MELPASSSLESSSSRIRTSMPACGPPSCCNSASTAAMRCSVAAAAALRLWLSPGAAAGVAAGAVVVVVVDVAVEEAGAMEAEAAAASNTGGCSVRQDCRPKKTHKRKTILSEPRKQTAATRTQTRLPSHSAARAAACQCRASQYRSQCPRTGCRCRWACAL